jgi:uncharacterized protein (DUF1697 family)
VSSATRPRQVGGLGALGEVEVGARRAELVVEVVDLGVLLLADVAVLRLDASSPCSAASTLAGDVYMHLPDGMGRARLPLLIERSTKRTGIVGTTRNWNTVERLLAML